MSTEKWNNEKEVSSRKGDTFQFIKTWKQLWKHNLFSSEETFSFRYKQCSCYLKVHLFINPKEMKSLSTAFIECAHL